MDANPFVDLGAPPEGDDPEAQLVYLRDVVEAFHATGNPRIKPLGKKLDNMLLELARGAEHAETEEQVQALANRAAKQVAALQLQTYEILLTVINQMRAALRVQLKRGMPATERRDSEQLLKVLAGTSQGMRKMLVAAKKGDRAAHDAGAAEMAVAGELLTPKSETPD